MPIIPILFDVETHIKADLVTGDVGKFLGECRFKGVTESNLPRSTRVAEAGCQSRKLWCPTAGIGVEGYNLGGSQPRRQVGGGIVAGKLPGGGVEVYPRRARCPHRTCHTKQVIRITGIGLI